MKRNRFCYTTYLEKILGLIDEEKFDVALRQFAIYLENYPNDKNAYLYYSDLLIKTGNFLEAERILKMLEITQKNLLEYQTWLLMSFKLLCCKGNYKEAYLFLENNPELLTFKSDLKESLLFLKKMLKMDIKKKDSKSYLAKQISAYKERNFFNHVRENHIKNNENTLLFLKSFPLYKVTKKIKKMLPTKGVIYCSPITSFYYFRFDHCGTIGDKSVDFIKVVALNSTNDLITMHPYENKGKLAYTDLNPFFLYEEKSLSRVKRVSQIEKFNEKYKRYFN